MTRKRLLLFGGISALTGGLIALSLFLLVAGNHKSYRSFADQEPPVHQTSLDLKGSAGLPEFSKAADMTVHAVVHIKTFYERKSSVYDDFFGFYDFFGFDPFQQGRSYPIEASGSGVIIADDGYIVTNNHVVAEADRIEVTLNDKRTYEAKIIGTDPSTDLALIKIEGEKLPYITLGNSDDIVVGEWVLAVGNPFNLTSTVTAGIVSAKARNINILGDRSAIESFIQTDAAVNRGNSGGALVNTRGELVGINAAIASNTGNYTGYSFAIPANLVKKVMDDLLEFGEVQRAMLGVSIMELDSKLAEEKDIDELKGVYIAGVTAKGAADEAGLKEGDVILELDGVTVNSKSELLEQIGQKRPGDRVGLRYQRNGKEKVVKVTLLNRVGSTDVVSKEDKNVYSMLGADFEEPSKEELEKLGLEHGVKIVKLGQGKLRSSGIRDGFIITNIDHKDVKSLGDIEKYLNNKKGGVLIEGVYPNGMRAYYAFGL